jgi:hypothetical protein
LKSKENILSKMKVKTDAPLSRERKVKMHLNREEIGCTAPKRNA